VRENIARRKLAAGQPITVIAPTYTSAGLVELCGHLGFDAVFLDTEHGPAGWEEIENMVRAAELTGMTPIIRVQDNDASTITRALDRGAGGIQVPHVNTREDAEAVVRRAKYHPLGVRGWAGGRASLGYSLAEFARRANEETLVVAMIEEVEALENLDDILRVEHLDVFFVAPGDLAQSMGHPGEVDHPEVQAAIDDALKRIRAAGRISGTLTTPATVQRYLDLGVQYLYVGLASLLTPAAKSFIGTVRR
jgi:4-hydroxy-2-oxoheptanedioate aldolase